MTTETLTWIGICLCVLQSGMFSGLNLAVFGLSPMELETQAASGNSRAARLRDMRQDSNFLLCTILWGNVGTNVLLALLSDSVMTGALAFFFSTFVITLGGEIVPQAYFSRHALKMATLLRPVLRLWEILLFPLAKPTALMLDRWLGPEGLNYLREAEVRAMLKHHIAAPESDVSRVEGVGALNFLAIDDLPVSAEGELLDPRSVIALPEAGGRPVIPDFECSPDDPFLRKIGASGRKWVVLTTPDGVPQMCLDANDFLRAALLTPGPTDIRRFCHRPITLTDATTPIGRILPRFHVRRESEEDDVIDDDVVLVWGDERRVITGADLLGRLLRGITRAADDSGQA
jgi:metal transporter CNNM